MKSNASIPTTLLRSSDIPSRWSRDLPMHFRFSDYSAQELADCGKAFAVDFADHRFESNKTEERTSSVLKWFCEAMAPGLRCCGRPTNGEFLVDQCHITSSLPWRGWKGRWPESPRECCEVRLALECEWGKYNNRKENVAAVLDDACKVAMVRAKSKVIIFATRHDLAGEDEDRTPIVDNLRSLRMNSRTGFTTQVIEY